ncbi:hypothetical protein, partial [Mycobacterium lacus]|uniref:hypothetical protein n=1 Tax=Mycobacterium lacus TaxID=169765 RepID=UPI001B803F5E
NKHPPEPAKPQVNPRNHLTQQSQLRTSRERNPLKDGQARAAIAAALLRWIHTIVTRRVTWDAAIAGPTELPAAA